MDCLNPIQIMNILCCPVFVPQMIGDPNWLGLAMLMESVTQSPSAPLLVTTPVAAAAVPKTWLAKTFV